MAIADPAGGSGAGRALLAICACPDGDHGAMVSALAPGDWDLLVALATAQRALPLLADAVKRCHADTRVPSDVRTAARAWLVASTQQMLLQRRTLRLAIGTLRPAGIEPMALKGVRLATCDYPRPVLRPMRDLDLLVPAAVAVRAQELLMRQAGFRLFDASEDYGIQHSHQLPPLVDPHTGCVVEVHHRLNASDWPLEAPFVQKMIARGQRIAVEPGLEVTVPSASDNFLHLVEHATLHHLFDNGPLVLADLHYAARSVDWKTVSGEARDSGLARALALVVAVARRHGANWAPADPDPLAPREDALELADRALLRPDARRRPIARLRRLEIRTGAPPGWRSALKAMRRPGTEALAQAGRSVAGAKGGGKGRPVLAYPVWLVRRLCEYARFRPAAGEAGESSRQVRLRDWLHGETQEERF